MCSSVSEALSPPRSSTVPPEYSYVLLATKVLPSIAPSSQLLAPFFSSEYSGKQPVFVLLQNGLGIEEELYEAARSALEGREEGNVRGSKTPQLVSCTIFIGTNLVDTRVVEHNNFVSPAFSSLFPFFIRTLIICCIFGIFGRLGPSHRGTLQTGELHRRVANS